MSATREQHIDFWQTLAEDMDRGKPLSGVLEHVADKLADSEFAEAASRMRKDILGGDCLSETMTRHKALFSKSACAMARAGEMGGVLDVIAHRVVDGIRDGSMPLPGGGAVEEDDQVVFWRAFARSISSGIPVLQVLDLLAEEVGGPKLGAAARTIKERLLEGSHIAPVLRTMPQTFAAEVCAAVEEGEEAGNLDVQAFRIADAIEAGDLGSLPKERVMANQDAGEEAGVSTACRLMLKQAIDQGVGDIHLEDFGDRPRIRFRIDGVLHDVQPPADSSVKAILSRFKIVSRMDIAERRLPQDGRVVLDLDGRKCDLRISCMPTLNGDRLSVRILDQETIQCRLSLQHIGLAGDGLKAVRDLCRLPHGLVVCAGPTGSGITTLLYSMLMEIDRDECCVMTVEDPVEFDLKGVAQVGINTPIGLTFERAIRSILRQDPDVLMVGETRNLETLQLCVQSALTGHLVLTTLHTNNAPGTLQRILDIGLPPFLVNSAVGGIVCQRLIRTLCDKCKVEAKPDLSSLPPEAVEFIRKAGVTTVFEPKGCDACRGHGYRGRTAVHEILAPDERVRHAVSSGDSSRIEAAALESGMKTMLIDALEKAVRGQTSLREACRVAAYTARL